MLPNNAPTPRQAQGPNPAYIHVLLRFLIKMVIICFLVIIHRPEKLAVIVYINTNIFYKPMFISYKVILSYFLRVRSWNLYPTLCLFRDLSVLLLLLVHKGLRNVWSMFVIFFWLDVLDILLLFFLLGFL